MTKTQGNLAGLSRFIFRVPQWYASLGAALVIAGVAGVVAFDSAYPFDDAWRGVFFIGLPTVIASVFTAPIDNVLGGRLTSNSASLLALVCELVLILVLLVAGLLSTGLGFTQEFVFDALIVGLAGIFALRLLIILAISQRRWWRSVLPASIQSVAAAALLFVYSGTLYYFQIGGPLLEAFFARPDETALELEGIILPFDFVLLGVVCLLHAVAVIGFLRIIDLPWRSSMGVSVLDFIQGFIGYLAGNSDELENFFVDLGEEAIVPISVLSFRRLDGGEKARFTIPMVHPGPMGDIGGGNLPVRLAESADGLSFAPHATAGHDFNLVTEREVDTICETVEEAADQITYSETATKGTRVSEGSATVTGHAFGDDGLLVNTFSPSCADDVEFSVGLTAISGAQASGLDDVLLADAHNCNDGLEGGDIGHVVPGSERSYDLIEGASSLGERLRQQEQGTLRLGTAWDETEWEPDDGIGPLGVRVAVLDVGDHRTAYILCDGNNMEPGLREQIIESIESVDVAEVLTSDTHIVNTVDAENQIGDQIPAERLIEVIQTLLAEAITDLEPVEAGVASERAEVTVFGNDRTEALASHANAMVPMATGLAAAFVFAILSVSGLIFLLAESVPA